MSFLFLLFVFGVLPMVAWTISRNKATVSDDEFRQAGVVVSFVKKTISIGGKEFPVSEVNDITIEGNIVSILVNDLINPRRTIRIPGMTKKPAKKFYDRLYLALQKAGAIWK